MASESTSKYYTLNRIPKHRQELIYSNLKEFIKKYNIKKWPIDCIQLLKLIQNHNDIKLKIKSSTALREHEDAKTIYIPEINMYLMAVNKRKICYPFKSSKDRRLNFTLAHEIAHIFLNHKDLPDEYKDSVLRELEDLEADEFAGRLLMPESKITTCNFTSLSNVATFFNVSESAILKRLSNLKHEHLRFTDSILVCENCENKEISANDSFCKICGFPLEKGSRGITTMIYDYGYTVDHTHRVKICPKCSNSNIEKDHIHCTICGQNLFNQCTNTYEECCKVVSGNARYCPTCGATTTFKNDNLLPDWDLTREILLNKMEFEDNLCKSTKLNQELEDWDFLRTALQNDGKNFVSSLLEPSSAKRCGETLVVYVKDMYIKNKLNTAAHIDLIKSKTETVLNIIISNVKIMTFEDFLPKDDTEEFDLPF